jgi:hypothetical protein
MGAKDQPDAIAELKAELATLRAQVAAGAAATPLPPALRASLPRVAPAGEPTHVFLDQWRLPHDAWIEGTREIYVTSEVVEVVDYDGAKRRETRQRTVTALVADLCINTTPRGDSKPAKFKSIRGVWHVAAAGRPHNDTCYMTPAEFESFAKVMQRA